MIVIVTKDQYKFLTEQSDFGMDRRGNNLLKTTGVRSDKDYKEVSQITDKAQATMRLDPHTLMTIVGISTAFIPMVGPFISLGIGLSDAAIYWNEGDKKTAGLVGLFAAIPGVGGLSAKLGLGKWSAKALGEIGKKISLGLKLTAVEAQVANRVAQYSELIKTQMNQILKQSKVLSGKKTANVLKGGKKLAGDIGTYAGVGYGYNKLYDKVSGPGPGVDLSSININDIGQENKKAAMSLKFD